MGKPPDATASATPTHEVAAGNHAEYRPNAAPRVSLAGRAVLLGVLTACVVYCLITVYSLITQGNNCLGPWRASPQCHTTLRHLMVPGRHEALVALICGLAAVAASVTFTYAMTPKTRRWMGRSIRDVEPGIVTVGLVILGAVVDPATRSIGAVIATGLLVWLTWRLARSFAAVEAELDATAGGVPPTVPAFNRLAARTLVAIPIPVAAAAIIVRFASLKDTPHVSARNVELCAGIYVLAAITLLAQAYYASLRQGWERQHAVVSRRLRGQWLKTGAFVLAGVILLAVVSPGLVNRTSEATSTVSGQFLGTVIGLIAHLGGPNQRDLSCRQDPAYCRRHRRSGPDDQRGFFNRGGGPHHHAAAHRVAAPGPWTRIVTWLVPIAVITFLLWNRSHQSGAGTGRVLALFQAVWRRLRRRSRGVFTAFTDRMPAGLLDPNRASGVGRLTGRGDLSPREQIQRYYLDTVTYAERHGMPRDAAQTPEAFASTLLQRLTEGRDAWTALTEDFIEARYSTHPVAIGQATRVRANWRATRIAIRDTVHGRTAR